MEENENKMELNEKEKAYNKTELEDKDITENEDIENINDEKTENYSDKLDVNISEEKKEN